MPDVARDAGEKDGGITPFKATTIGISGMRMALPEIFPQKERVDARGVAAHDHILVVVGKNLGLDEVARAQEIGDRARLAHGAERPFAKTFGSSCQACCSSLPKLRNVELFRQAKMLRDIDSLKAGQVAHPDVVKECKQIGVDEVTTINVNFG